MAAQRKKKSSSKYIFKSIMKGTISSSTPAKVVDVGGYRRYSILARFEGEPDASFKIEIKNGKKLVQQETVQLNTAGWLVFQMECTVFAPKIGIAVNDPPSKLKVNMTLYAGY